MSISVTSLPNSIGTGFNPNSTDPAQPVGIGSVSTLRFEQAMEQAGAPEPVVFFAPDRVNGPSVIDAAPHPEIIHLAQTTPTDVARTSPGGELPAQTFSAADPTRINRIGDVRNVDLPNREDSMKAPTTGQGIIDGLSRLRGVFDSQEQAITGISPSDVAGRSLTNSSELINLQLEVVKYSMLMDVTSKLAGKSTQTFDTLMKGQ